MLFYFSDLCIYSANNLLESIHILTFVPFMVGFHVSASDTGSMPYGRVRGQYI